MSAERIAELEALNAEYAARCDALEEELARKKQNASRFGEYLSRLDDVCALRGIPRRVQHFRRDPALPGSSDQAWCAWVGEAEETKGYGKSGEAAIRALVERMERG